MTQCRLMVGKRVCTAALTLPHGDHLDMLCAQVGQMLPQLTDGETEGQKVKQVTVPAASWPGMEVTTCHSRCQAPSEVPVGAVSTIAPFMPSLSQIYPRAGDIPASGEKGVRDLPSGEGSTELASRICGCEDEGNAPEVVPLVSYT